MLRTFHLPVTVSVALILAASGFVVIHADEGGPKPTEGAYGGRGDKDSREKWDSLSDEDREKLRKALREVWTDPGVLSAREEVRVASESYQKAIRNAIGKADPSVAGLLTEVQAMNEGATQDRLKGSGPGRFSPYRGIEYPAGPPTFLEKLTSEEREMFKAAEEKAQNSEAVLGLKKEMEDLKSQDEQVRRRRMEVHFKIRRAVLDEIFSSSPELKSLESRLGIDLNAKGKGRPLGIPPKSPQNRAQEAKSAP